jgi:hypothetical protein
MFRVIPPSAHYCFIPALLVCAIALGGCDRHDTIETYQVSKTLPVPSADAAQPASDTAPTIHWAVPDGWKSLPGHDLRFASFQVSPQDPSVQLTVVPLGAQAGSLVANVDRWEKQLGLPPTAEADLAKVVTMVDVGGVPTGLVDLSQQGAGDGHPPQRLLAAIMARPDRTWFFKLAGPSTVIDPQKDKFDAFIQSVRFDSDESQASAAQTPATQPAPLVFAAPAGWVQEPASNALRVAAFHIPSNGQSAEVVVAKLPAGSGTVLENVNRWRGQVGLDAVADPTGAPAEAVKIAGLDAALWDFQGAGSAASQPAPRIVVAMLTRGSDWWFFKLEGPADLVGAQKDAFMGFLDSVRFPGDTQ